jgi:hypothetical protein
MFVIVISVLALLTDWAVSAGMLGEFRRSGHLHIDVRLVVLAGGLTSLSIVGWMHWRRSRTQREPPPGARSARSSARPGPPSGSSGRPSD